MRAYCQRLLCGAALCKGELLIPCRVCAAVGNDKRLLFLRCLAVKHQQINGRSDCNLFAPSNYQGVGCRLCDV